MVEGITAPGSFVHLPASTERTMEVSSRLSYKSYQAWIKIDGKESQCYSTDVDHAKKTVTCWIASEAGKVRQHAAHLDFFSGCLFLSDFFYRLPVQKL